MIRRFRWANYLDFAHEQVGLSTHPISNETRHRCAISRAYYAAFNIARDFIEQKDGVVIANLDVHRRVIEHFASSADTRRIIIADQLWTIRNYRNQADYDASMRDVVRKTAQSVQMATRIIDELGRL